MAADIAVLVLLTAEVWGVLHFCRRLLRSLRRGSYGQRTAGYVSGVRKKPSIGRFYRYVCTVRCGGRTLTYSRLDVCDRLKNGRHVTVLHPEGHPDRGCVEGDTDSPRDAFAGVLLLLAAIIAAGMIYTGICSVPGTGAGAFRSAVLKLAAGMELGAMTAIAALLATERLYFRLGSTVTSGKVIGISEHHRHLRWYVSAVIGYRVHGVSYTCRFIRRKYGMFGAGDLKEGDEAEVRYLTKFPFIAESAIELHWEAWLTVTAIAALLTTILTS